MTSRILTRVLRQTAKGGVAGGGGGAAPPSLVKVHVCMPDGTDVDFDAPTNLTMMEAIRDVGKLFIEDCCSGRMACTACHVYVDPAWMEKVGQPREEEQDMLDQAIKPNENSRLSCQIKLAPELDGVKITLPAETINLMFVTK